MQALIDVLARWFHRNFLGHWQTRHEVGADRWVRCRCGMRWPVK